jgi:hypothetical protein
MMEQSPCGRAECIFKAVENMISRMKEEIVKTQSIAYPEQVRVAEIYNIVASTMAEACRKNFKIPLDNCVEKENHKSLQVSMDTFILLKTMLDDALITEEYKNQIFEMLLKMNPDLKEKVEKDKCLGIF